jgi:hypothetical protein
VSEIKINLNQIRDNLNFDSTFVPQLIEQDNKNTVTPNLVQAEAEIKSMKEVVSTVLKAIPRVTDVQKELLNEGQDELDQSLSNLDKEDDTELKQIAVSMNLAVKKGESAIKKVKDDEAKKLLKAVEEEKGKDLPVGRSQAEKEEMAAFLGGKTN